MLQTPPVEPNLKVARFHDEKIGFIGLGIRIVWPQLRGSSGHFPHEARHQWDQRWLVDVAPRGSPAANNEVQPITEKAVPAVCCEMDNQGSKPEQEGRPRECFCYGSYIFLSVPQKTCKKTPPVLTEGAIDGT